jgi:uncharacterized protein
MPGIESIGGETLNMLRACIVRPAVLAGLAAMPCLSAVAEPLNMQAAADLRTCAKPVWPKEALREKQQGTVTLGFLVGVDGSVADSSVQGSSGFPLLDVAAREGLMKCRFRPATRDGKAIPAWVQMQYVWTLDPSAGAFDKAAAAARAQKGDMAAQVALARHFLSVNSADRDPQKAEALLRDAVEKGNLAAMELLASTLWRGTAVPKDTAQAQALYRRAAEAGSATAQYVVGRMLVRGDGVPKDVKQGEEWLRKSAGQGNPHAQLELAWVLRNGGAVSPEMIALLKGAAARNLPVAQRVLGGYYEHGTTVEQDYAMAADLYRKAAAAGDNPAKEGLARLYGNGRGVPLDKAVADALLADAAASASARSQAAALAAEGAQ